MSLPQDQPVNGDVFLDLGLGDISLSLKNQLGIAWPCLKRFRFVIILSSRSESAVTRPNRSVSNLSLNADRRSKSNSGSLLCGQKAATYDLLYYEFDNRDEDRRKGWSFCLVGEYAISNTVNASSFLSPFLGRVRTPE